MLKRVLLTCLLASVATPSVVKAMCAHGGQWSITQRSLPTNGIIVLEGYRSGIGVVVRAVVRGVVVQSDTDRVPVEVVSTHEGEMYLAQVMLRPVRLLAPDTEYRLVMPDGPLVAQGMTSFRTTRVPDREAPRWRREPVVESTPIIHYGCGPKVSAVVDVGDAAPYIEATIGATTYVVPVYEGKTELGHEMCSGAFRIPPDTLTTASLVLMDAAGNRSEAKTVSFIITEHTTWPQPRARLRARATASAALPPSPLLRPLLLAGLLPFLASYALTALWMRRRQRS